MKIIKNIIAISLLFVTVGVCSQEFSAYVSGGISGKKYEFNQGELTSKIGGNIGFGYAYPLHTNWSILTGLELGIYRNNFKLNNYSYNGYGIDKINSAFEYRLKANSYEENSAFKSLNIPLMIQYKTKSKLPLYVNVGAKLLLPMKEKVSSRASNLELQGYYPDLNLLFDEHPTKGFGAIDKLATETENKLQTAVAFSTELGTYFKLSQKSKLYAGLYFDYGITAIQKTTKSNTSTPLVNYNANGLDNVTLNNAVTFLSPKDDVKILAYGIQLRYAFGRAKKTVEPIVEETPIVEKIIEEPVKKQPVKKAAPVKVVKVAPVKTIPEVKTSKLQEIETIIITDLEPLDYDFNTSELQPKFKASLDKIAMLLEEDKAITVLIESHTDSRGSKAYNMKLSEKRATTIYNYLISRGVDKSRVSYEYFGETQLLNRCKDGVRCSKDEHKENRRTVLKVYKK